MKEEDYIVKCHYCGSTDTTKIAESNTWNKTIFRQCNSCKQNFASHVMFYGNDNEIEMPYKIHLFLKDIDEVFKKHNLSIEFDREYSGMIIHKYTEDDICELNHSTIDIENEKIDD